MKSTFSAERTIEAPADVVYHCIADYRAHHRPEGFLPEAFSDLQIERGGMGAGTELRWVVEAGEVSQHATAGMGPSTAVFESSGHPAGVPEAAERNAVLALGFIR